MSKLSKAVSEMAEKNNIRLDETVKNFMNGDSYTINPLDTLKMITASSIFGEPSYYINSRNREKYYINNLIKEFSIIPYEYEGKTTEEIIEKAIDKALGYDFGATIEWAKNLRSNFNMRLNPQVIMVRAAIHPKRQEFTEKNPGKFDEINQDVMKRADDCMSQMSYYLYNNKGKKNNIPSIIKRSWAKNISKLNSYKVAKYKNHEIGMINAVRICHASSPVIDELMKTGTVKVNKDDKTWENLRSAGKSWKEILNTIDLGHMALLRNLRNIFTEINDIDFCKKIMEKLKNGVANGKQFPFRYQSAIKAVTESSVNHLPIIIDALEECADIALSNLPKLKGKTMCLSDNSGSAWGSITSEYGCVKIAEIDNLSSIITAACSDEGYVGKFGDTLKLFPISKRDGILQQSQRISHEGCEDVGGSTEGGIWKFFRDAINKKEHWDNIFIYSDQQAGHGGLYGTHADEMEYSKQGFGCLTYINVFALVQEYRKRVNTKVNIFSIQTAGYDNVLIPEYAYRTNIMYGWTGKEVLFASEMIKQWDEIENRK